MGNYFDQLGNKKKFTMLSMTTEEVYELGVQRGLKITGSINTGSQKRRVDVAEEFISGFMNDWQEEVKLSRKEVVEKAKKFVKEHETDLPGRWECRDYGNHTCRSVRYKTVFSFERNKVTATVYYKDIFLQIKTLCYGEALCREDDVYNEWIGKAVALAKALEIDIPKEFLNAPQPDKIVVGQIIERKYVGFDRKYVRTIESIHTIHGGKQKYNYTTGTYDTDLSIENTKVLDDTNAYYEEEK